MIELGRRGRGKEDEEAEREAWEKGKRKQANHAIWDHFTILTTHGNVTVSKIF